MAILFIISLLFTVAFAEQHSSLSCNYFLQRDVDRYVYGCQLTINNPNGLNNFTEIGGIHLERFTNADVEDLFRASGVSPNVPSIICDTFPNLVRIKLFYTGLLEIGDSDFRGCSRAYEINLAHNSISSISANAFVNLHEIGYMYLNYNLLRTLPENVFASQQNLTRLDIGSNTYDHLPVGFLRPLKNLQFLNFGYANLSAINNQWFENNKLLRLIYLGGNKITLAEDSFAGLDELVTLNMAACGISKIPARAFARLPNLKNLLLYINSFTELLADSFPDLGHLDHLDISNNPIEVIHNGAFRGLSNLTSLNLELCSLRQLHSNSFEGLTNLASINMNLNKLEELPQNVFIPSASLSHIGLWNNRLKTLHRNSFGTLTSLQTLNLVGNIVNGLDRAVIDDAVNLNSLFFNENLCANNYFADFVINRVQHLQALERCFSNLRYIIDTITEGNDEFSFFEGPHPGIAIRVNTDNEVQIALTPFNFIWSPMIEILIGTINNTRSVIRTNQVTDVVTVPTPNIIKRDQWNEFRVTWENQVILVYSANDSFPFMGFTMQDFFPVNFYGLKAVETRASWGIQPVQ